MKDENENDDEEYFPLFDSLFFTLDENHHPMMLENPTIFEIDDALGKRVAFTTFEVNGITIEVSTVFLGIQIGSRPPKFETMIFGGIRDNSQWKYSTYEEAMAHHEKILHEFYGIAVNKRCKTCGTEMKYGNNIGSDECIFCKIENRRLS